MGRSADGSVVAAWRGRLARQRRSGLSVAEFCRRERVSPPSFYQWRRRLQPDGHVSPAQPLFVPIELPASGNTAGVEIELPGGAVVRLPADASTGLLTTAIHAAMHSAGSAGSAGSADAGDIVATGGRPSC